MAFKKAKHLHGVGNAPTMGGKKHAPSQKKTMKVRSMKQKKTLKVRSKEQVQTQAYGVPPQRLHLVRPSFTQKKTMDGDADDKIMQRIRKATS